MLHSKLPDDAVLMQRKNDAGKRVTVTSCGGAMVKMRGTVLVGPYTYQYLHKYKVQEDQAKDKYGRERVKYKEEIRTSAPMWLVKIDGFQELSFMPSEIVFG